MQVLNSINWSLVKFDVLCIETDPPNRPKGYAEEMTAFLKKKGYENHYGQIGRNICKFIVSVFCGLEFAVCGFTPCFLCSLAVYNVP